MHFTYDTPPESGDLLQGDLLKRTPALETIIDEYHPYYKAKHDYTHFLVLTQSCDLVRRHGKQCASPYISLAAVRPLHVAIEHETAVFKQTAVLQRANAVSEKHKQRVEMFMEKLMNNNSKDYFYLHAEPTLGFNSSCAFLQLAISFRADEHYLTCQAARILTLNNEFRAKLGWMVGNIFARVGTTDWKKEELKKQIQSTLEENVVWVNDEKLKGTTLSDEELMAMTAIQVVERINATTVEKKKDKVIVAILNELTKNDYIAADQLEPIKKALTVAPTVSAYFKGQ